MKFFLYLPLIPLFLLLSCTDPKQTAESSEVTAPYTTGSSLLDSTLAAHGGAELWKSFAQMTFSKQTGNGPIETHLVDLRSRKVLITADTFQLGFDGKDVWVAPSMQSSPSRNPRFYHNLWFYFAAVPFVFTDPGVEIEELAPVETDSVDYNKIKITFGNAVGDSPEDQYILYTDKTSHQLRFINYSVTYYDTARAESYSALVYSDYQRINGLLMPGKLTGYKWTDGTLGDQRYGGKLMDYSFSVEAADASLFEKPGSSQVYEEK